MHLLVGALVLVTGLALYSGAVWARGIAIALAVVSAITNFFFIPYYPIWSLLIIALDVFVIWAVAADGRARAAMLAGGGGSPREGRR